jgi:AmmeMemoRadiSam system protein A
MPSHESHPLPPDQAGILLTLARDSIRHGLDLGRPLAVDLESLPRALRALRATFVTLEKGGELRGCMGRLEAARPLAEDVASNAFAAAFQDFRFPPVTEGELKALAIHLSLLTHPEPLPFADEADLAGKLVPGRDGVILEAGGRRGTFLPSVWESLPDPGEFLVKLKAKAGIPRGTPFRAFRYGTEVLG